MKIAFAPRLAAFGAAVLFLGSFLSGCEELGLDLSSPAAPPADIPATLEFPTLAPDDGARATATADAASPLPTTGSIEVYFTGDKQRARALEKALTSALGAARQSIDLAMYNFSLDAAGEALLAAQERGVRVRIVTDSDALDGRWFERFHAAGIELLGDGREELMHNKFLVIDGREVWTGSLNLTQSGTYQDDNNYVRFVSSEMAQRYSAVFEAMFTDGQFGPERAGSGLDPRLDVAGVPVEVYFSPEDGPSTRLVELVRGADESVRILAYSFTSNALSDALLEQVRAGLKVQGVFDADQSDGQGADYAYLRQSGMDARSDGNPGLMHNKVILIDDETVVFGSYNFTRAADRSNDENLVVVQDARIAALYRAEFERIYAEGQ